jgi:conjugative transfer region lipoprotein (TIGR03751 family)
MRRISTESIRACRIVMALLALAALAGCATRKEAVLPHGNATMLDLWNQYTGGEAGGSQADQNLLKAREVLRRPLTEGELKSAIAPNASYTRTAENEANTQFKRLPDPDLVMYVFPHLAGTDPVPVPGYSTVFSFYERVHYAMPGERTKAY